MKREAPVDDPEDIRMSPAELLERTPARTRSNQTANSLTADILVAISRTYNPNCHVFRVNVVIARTKFRTVRSAPNGTSDLIGSILGKPFAIEIKAARDRLSSDQILFRDQWVKSGGVYIVAREVEKCMEEIREWLK